MLLRTAWVTASPNGSVMEKTLAKFVSRLVGKNRLFYFTIPTLYVYLSRSGPELRQWYALADHIHESLRQGAESSQFISSSLPVPNVLFTLTLNCGSPPQTVNINRAAFQPST